MNDALITMTVGDFKQCLANLKEEIVEAFREEMSLGREPSEVTGIKNIAEALSVSISEVSRLLKSGELGHALWKRQTMNGNGKTFMEVSRGRRRYQELHTFSLAELQAWRALGAEVAEQEWQARGL